MMIRFKSWIERWKPAARVRTHLFAAAALWTAVGLGLAGIGFVWCFSSAFPWSVILSSAGIAAGLAKGRFIIWKMADWNSKRIIARGDGRCLGGFLSVKTWLLVIVMMTSGIILRHSSVPHPILGLIYSAVGTALLVGSLRIWKAYQEEEIETQETQI
ncbi:MAG: hypothetical protein MUP98_17155 [Candidatus Aminicenantes bacterium]|nr:hypothetical protein [Candidatus Aminicenantes bacterium]